MKRIVLLLTAIITLLTAVAQDIIVTSDGERMTVYDLKVGKKFITYRLTPGGTSKRIGKARVTSYKKQKKAAPTVKNIETEKPDTTTQQTGEVLEITIAEKPRKPEKITGEIKRATADNNSRLIEQYSKPHNGYGTRQSNGTPAKYAIAIMGIADGSVLSNEDIEVEFEAYERIKRARMQYCIYIHNKSDKTIYIDLENTFRIFNNGTFEPYYKGKQIKQNKRNEKLLTVEHKAATYSATGYGERESTSRKSKYTAQSSSNTSLNSREQKVAAIPPMGKLALPAETSVDNNNEIVKRYDSFSTTLHNPGGEVIEWQATDLDEAKSPYRNSFHITYSTDKRFTTYSTMKFTIYAKQLIGIPRNTLKFRSGDIHGYDRHTIYGEAYIKPKK